MTTHRHRRIVLNRPAHSIETEHGRICHVDHGGAGPAVLFLHGNSSAKEIFARQFASEALSARHRLLAFDLPGHGGSQDAPAPERSYSIHGFADAAIAYLGALGIERAVLVGWSLGGHIALELMARWPGTIAAWIVGTPPAGRADMGAAFRPSPHMALTFQDSFTDDEARCYAQEAIGAGVPLEPWMLAAARRADGRFRRWMAESALAGRDLDGREIAETSPLPLAVVCGGDDPFVDTGYLASVRYRNLWDGQVHLFEGLGHAPFWEAPERVDPLFARFLADVA
jgi:pimeloyl-ACP methyl ester carboxylesterase